MICPKCRFEQPDDIYCASCGVNIDRYVRQKKKKRYRAYLAIVFIGVAVVAAAKYVKFPGDSERPDLTSRYNEEETRPEIALGGSPISSSSRTVSDVGQDSRRPAGRVQTRPPRGSSVPRGRELSQIEPSDPTTATPEQAAYRQERDEKTFTAIYWLERGIALDDESEAEEECYQNAIQLDSGLAPAYFRLGAIYYRRANYELADQEFAKFLENASEADKVAYNIYVYYSLSDVDRLIAAETETDAEHEEAEKTVEVEAEEVTEETPSETETETEEAVYEEESEETSEEVNTIVRFLAYDGHIVVPVTLNGIEDAHVLVDTGSSITILSREMAERLDLENKSGKSVTLRTMASDIEADLVMLSSIQVGDLVQNNLAVAVTDLPTRVKADFDGILGMDFMNHYEIRIDNKNQRIIFSPGKRGW